MTRSPVSSRAADAPARTALLRHPWGWLATGFGAGLAPRAPGTVGSIVALVPYVAMMHLAWWSVWIAIVVVFALGVVASRWAIATLGRDDPGEIVVDEFVGQWLALATMDAALRYAPGTLYLPSPLAFLVVGLIAFRVFDVAKPWPVSWADRTIHGGFGAMLDDAIAGVMAGVLGIVALYAVAFIATR